MLGQMMSQPLLISSLLVHAERHHGTREIVSRRVEGDIHRYTYRDLARRSRRASSGRSGRRRLAPRDPSATATLRVPAERGVTSPRAPRRPPFPALFPRRGGC